MSVSLRTRRFLVLSGLLLAIPLRHASAGEVWVVQGPGTGHYATIQAAVDAAGDGGILIAGPGAYAPFVIDGKSIVLYAKEGATAHVDGTVEIKNIASGKAVFVAGLTVTGVATLDGSSPALRLSSSFGQIRFRDCTFQGGRGTDTEGICTDVGRGSAGAIVDGCTRVAFASCTIAGGRGGNIEYNYECEAFAGGDGLASNQSTISLVRCVCTGGKGGDAGEIPGNGGRGCAATGNGFVASGTTFTGGRGGDAWDFIASNGADGGDGVFLASNTGVHILDCALVGGTGGTGLDTNGDPGDPTSGPGIIVQHAGATRWVAGPRISSDATTATITFHGTQGDQMIEQGSSALDFHLFPAMVGFRFILPPLVDLTTPVTVPASGTIAAGMPVLDVAAPTVATMLYTQGTATDPQSAAFLENALDVLVLNRAGPPDCNGNGVLDYFDVLEGVSPDCDGNLVPDECDVASGTGDCNGNLVPDACDIAEGQSSDCNGNQVPDECDLASGSATDCNGNHVLDSCDIASGHSQDLDQDGVPDECEPPVVWYVLPTAPAGGNGSSASPFQTIRQAINVSQSGDTILLLDGIYSTVSDRNLAFGPRRLNLRSLNGPEHCILDCQHADRAFVLTLTLNPGSLIEGITIRNGMVSDVGGAIRADQCTLTVRNCVFQNCQGLQHGGALWLAAAGGVVVEDCVFDGNSTSTVPSSLASGGAIFISQAEGAIVRRCRFQGNVAVDGGALATWQTRTDRYSHCVFRANSAVLDGGAAWSNTLAVVASGGLSYDDCSFEQNVAGRDGGAIYNRLDDFNSATYRLTVSSSTFVGNTAARGGAVAGAAGYPLTVVDSILWGNSAGTGSQIALLLIGQPPHLDISYCDVQGGSSGIDVGPGSLTYGPGNLAADPLFAAGRYSLDPDSPCIDAGSNALASKDFTDVDGDANTVEAVPLDLSLRARFLDVETRPDTGVGPGPVIDMGAYETRVPRPTGRWRTHP